MVGFPALVVVANYIRHLQIANVIVVADLTSLLSLADRLATNRPEIHFQKALQIIRNTLRRTPEKQILIEPFLKRLDRGVCAKKAARGNVVRLLWVDGEMNRNVLR